MSLALGDVALGRAFPAYVRVDAEGLIRAVGPSLRRLAPKIVAGDPFASRFTFERPSQPRPLAVLAERIESVSLRLIGANLLLNGLVVADGDGQAFLVSHAAANVLKPAGSKIGFADFSPADSAVEALTLITLRQNLLDEAREATVELARARDEALAATRAKTEFLANMSHELRTPLTGIVGFAELLADGQASPEQQRTYAARIATLGGVLLNLVNDVLDLEKIDAGRLDLDPQPFAPAAFIKETVELLRLEAQNKKLTLDLQAAGPLPDRIVADCARLRQILLNLLHNAIKFTPSGRITVRVRHAESAGGILRVSVEDTGLGVPRERRDRLFERFSRLDVRRERNQPGTGLGLSICKGLVEAMGGRIAYLPGESGGSIFWFEIPAPVAARAGPRLLPELVRRSADPLNILVVDDVASNREVISAILRKRGHQVAQAQGGEEAVARAEQRVFDVILMDAQMPGMDGFAATEAIRRSSTLNADTPIIGISADATRRHWAAGQAAGMNDHVTKPINFTELMEKIGRLARQRS